MVSQAKSINEQIADVLAVPPLHERERTSDRPRMERQPGAGTPALSFIFFSDANQAQGNKYQLVLDLADFADANGFAAVWMPERHFHPFGGIYANPAVLAAALAVRTSRIRLRSGSVVLPLHHPAEVVETWAMVDNLSNGRVDLGFASGWNPNDFILSPGTYANLREVWHERVPLVQALWRGAALSFPNGKGEDAEIRVYPRPVQDELSVWLAATKRDETFQYAGAQGYNVLTMLQGIDLDELGRKIGLYKAARKESGLDPEGGQVTLMLHTLVLDSVQRVEEAVREPFFRYIKSALTGHLQAMDPSKRPSAQEIDKIVEYSYERYFRTGALFGSMDRALDMARKSAAVGVTEIACLMDFGIDHALVMESLPYLARLNSTLGAGMDAVRAHAAQRVG